LYRMIRALHNSSCSCGLGFLLAVESIIGTFQLLNAEGAADDESHVFHFIEPSLSSYYITVVCCGPIHFNIMQLLRKDDDDIQLHLIRTSTTRRTIGFETRGT
jgi:hypothetical protein